MTSTGTLLRMIGAAILLIAVQFASVAAKAHAGHGHGPDGHHLQGMLIKAHGAAAGIAHSISSDEAAPANRAAQTQPAAQAEATAQNAPGALPSGSDACVMGCCGLHGLLRQPRWPRFRPTFLPERARLASALHALFPFPEWTPEVCANPLDPSPE